MKAFTDIAQSKKLAEILPIESADAWWAERYEGKVTYDGQYIVNEEPFYYISFIKPSEINYSQDTVKDIPCWSLVALLGVMPRGENKDLSLVFGSYDGGYHPLWFCTYEEMPTILEICNADNPIDACVEMIYKLKERNLL